MKPDRVLLTPTGRRPKQSWNGSGNFENMRRAAGWDRQLEVGIISGYQGQVEQLNRLISPEDHGDRWQSLRIEIATVDAFQGRECDVVVYSTVRSNRDGRIGFLGDHTTHQRSSVQSQGPVGDRRG